MFKPEVWQALQTVAHQSVAEPFWPAVLKAILAGWLIALMVWLLPSAGPAKVLIVVALTYTISIGQFPHSIAGSCEAAFAVIAGHAPFWSYFTEFLLPAVLGNTIGGVALCALLNHAPLAAEA